jgi:hypothetical protein
MLWTEITNEHPIFIKTIASLTKKNLDKAVLEKLMDINRIFSELHKNVEQTKENVDKNPYMFYSYKTEVNSYIEQFLKQDKYFLSILPDVKRYGKTDKVWQELLEHITHEQTFMFELFSDLKSQIM